MENTGTWLPCCFSPFSISSSKSVVCSNLIQVSLTQAFDYLQGSSGKQTQGQVHRHTYKGFPLKSYANYFWLQKLVSLTIYHPYRTVSRRVTYVCVLSVRKDSICYVLLPTLDSKPPPSYFFSMCFESTNNK